MDLKIVDNTDAHGLISNDPKYIDENTTDLASMDLRLFDDIDKGQARIEDDDEEYLGTYPGLLDRAYSPNQL